MLWRERNAIVMAVRIMVACEYGDVVTAKIR